MAVRWRLGGCGGVWEAGRGSGCVKRRARRLCGRAQRLPGPWGRRFRLTDPDSDAGQGAEGRQDGWQWRPPRRGGRGGGGDGVDEHGSRLGPGWKARAAGLGCRAGPARRGGSGEGRGGRGEQLPRLDGRGARRRGLRLNGRGGQNAASREASGEGRWNMPVVLSVWRPAAKPAVGVGYLRAVFEGYTSRWGIHTTFLGLGILGRGHALAGRAGAPSCVAPPCWVAPLIRRVG